MWNQRSLGDLSEVIVDIGQDQSEWVQNGHSSLSGVVQVFFETMLKKLVRNHVLVTSSGDTNVVTEVVNGIGREASSTETV